MSEMMSMLENRLEMDSFKEEYMKLLKDKEEKDETIEKEAENAAKEKAERLAFASKVDEKKEDES